MAESSDDVLGSYLRFRNGKTSPDRTEAGVFPVFGSNGSIGRANDSNAAADTIIIGRVGTYCGSLQSSKSACWVTDNAIICTPPDGEGNFWFYALASLGLNNYRAGSGQPLLNQSILRSIRLRVPAGTERIKIGRLLGILDDKIDLNRKTNETLEAMARAILKDWFVDFGPARAKVEGRTPYLAADLWDLFPEVLDDEGKPRGWSRAPLTAIAAINPESWSERNTPEEVEYVDLANTKWGTIETTQWFPWQEAPSRARRILRPGDTVVGMVRPGNGSYAYVSDPGLTGSTGFAVLRPRQPRHRELVFLSATAPENVQRLSNLADGAAYPAVRPDVVGATEIVFCDDAEVAGFSALVSPMFDLMESNKRENKTLAQTRNLLLPKLMSGEIRLTEAEGAVEAVA